MEQITSAGKDIAVAGILGWDGGHRRSRLRRDTYTTAWNHFDEGMTRVGAVAMRLHAPPRILPSGGLPSDAA